MYENLLLVVDFEKICRLCLHSTGVMSNIFDNNEENTLAEQILRATGLEIQPGDGLPSKICHKCRYVVELSCELRCMVTRVNTLLTEATSSQITTEYSEEAGEKDTANTTGEQANPLNRHQENRKPDLKLVLQDDGKLVLVKQNLDRNEHVEDINADDKECDGIKMNKNDYNFLFPKSKERTRKAAPKHLTCQICLTSFPTEEQVTAHVNTHYKDTILTPYLQLQRPFECEACKEGAISKTQLVVHHRRHLHVNPFVCKQPGCSFVGKNQNSLRHHLVVHGARQQVCEACGARYRRRWELRQHEQRAHRAAPRACRVCRRQFRNVLTYRAHLRTHERAPRHACGWRGCPKAYHSRAALDAHARTHSAERRYACPLCAAAAYTSQSLLNRHLRMHARARTSRCDKCAATFEDYGAFYRHRVAQHGPWQPYRCAGCNQGYQSESQLNKHIQLCELAIRMQSYSAQFPQSAQSDASDTRLVASTREVTEAEKQPVEPKGLDRSRGRSILVQPGNVNELVHNLVMHELPPDGLLYIEAQPAPDCEENASTQVWRQ